MSVLLQRSRCRFFAVVLCLLAFGLCATNVVAAPVVPKQDAPDFHQYRDSPSPPFPYPSDNYCIPTAVADGIVWLYDHGLDRLPHAAPATQSVYDLVMDLAQEMQTDQVGAGTFPVHARDGLINYLSRTEHYPADWFVEGRGLDLDGAYPDQTDWNWTGQMLDEADQCVLVMGYLYFRWRYPPTFPDWGEWTQAGGHGVFLAGYEEPATSYVYDPATGPDKELDAVDLTWQGQYYLLDIALELPDSIKDQLPPGVEIQTELRWQEVLAYGAPEPATCAVLGVGLGFVMLRRRYRTR